jgi:hypothetical protein
MNAEKKLLLEKIHKLINDKKEVLLKEYPDVHEVDDGIIVRFFTEWDNCEDAEEIKFKKLESEVADENVVFWYLPKGSSFELNQKFFIGCMTCLNGKMEIEVNDETIFLESYEKKCVNSEEVKAKVLENTYLLTTSNKKVWSKTTWDHVEQYK